MDCSCDLWNEDAKPLTVDYVIDYINVIIVLLRFYSSACSNIGSKVQLKVRYYSTLHEYNLHSSNSPALSDLGDWFAPNRCTVAIVTKRKAIEEAETILSGRLS